MAHEYSVDPKHRSVHMRLSGVLTFHDLFAAMADLADDPRISRDFVELIDLHDVSSIAQSLGYEQIHQVATTRLDAVSRRAFVANQPGVFGVCRIFASCRESIEGAEPVAVFRNEADATTWLRETS